MPNETLDPSDVGPLGVQRFVPYPQLAPHLLDDRRLGGVDPADQMPLVLHARPARTKSVALSWSAIWLNFCRIGVRDGTAVCRTRSRYASIARTACNRCQAGVLLFSSDCKSLMTSSWPTGSRPSPAFTLDACRRIHRGNHSLSFLPNLASCNSLQKFATLILHLPQNF